MKSKDIFYAVWLPDKQKFAGWEDDLPSTRATPVEIENMAVVNTPKEAWALAGLMNIYGYTAQIAKIDVEQLERECEEADEVLA